MCSYTRGILNAYRDVLCFIELLDPQHSDKCCNDLIQLIDKRCDAYLEIEQVKGSIKHKHLSD